VKGVNKRTNDCITDAPQNVIQNQLKRTTIERVVFWIHAWRSSSFKKPEVAMPSRIATGVAAQIFDPPLLLQFTKSCEVNHGHTDRIHVRDAGTGRRNADHQRARSSNVFAFAFGTRSNDLAKNSISLDEARSIFVSPKTAEIA